MGKSDKLLTDLERLLKTQQFKDEMEIHRFLESLAGQTIPEIEPEALSNEERAEDLVIEASEMETNKAVIKVFEALDLDSDCIPAYELLGMLQYHPQLAIPFFAYGIELGRKKFEASIQVNRGHFWGIHETRPFIRCLYHCANSHFALGCLSKAQVLFEEILELNQNDNLGVRFPYGLLLIAAKQYEEFRKLDKKFKEDQSAQAAFNRVFYSFCEKGQCDDSMMLLQKAKKENKHISRLLSANSPPKDLPINYVSGSKEEALIYADYAWGIWQNAEGAIAFLKNAGK